VPGVALDANSQRQVVLVPAAPRPLAMGSPVISISGRRPLRRTQRAAYNTNLPPCRSAARGQFC
jgi:hypothetical protein